MYFFQEVKDDEFEYVYDNVLPIYPIIINDKKLIREFKTFDEAVDEYFSKQEINRSDNKTSNVCIYSRI